MTNDAERFKACAQAYGAQARHWPAVDRALYARFAATEEGVAILAAEARTDDLLDAWTPSPVERALADRIAEAVLSERPRRRRKLSWLQSRFAATGEGAANLAAETRSEDVLDAWTPSPVERAFADRIPSAILNERSRQHRMVAWSAVAFAASAAFGLVVGFVKAPPDPGVDLVTLFIVGPSATPGIGL